MPALLSCVEAETNQTAFENAMLSAVGRFGTNAQPWAHVLVGWIDSNRFGIHSFSVVRALRRIDPARAEVYMQKAEASRGDISVRGLSLTNSPAPVINFTN